jgi:hypothetical protein
LQALAVLSPDTERFELVDGLIKLHGRVWIGENSAIQRRIIHVENFSAEFVSMLSMS